MCDAIVSTRSNQPRDVNRQFQLVSLIWSSFNANEIRLFAMRACFLLSDSDSDNVNNKIERNGRNKFSIETSLSLASAHKRWKTSKHNVPSKAFAMAVSSSR